MADGTTKSDRCIGPDVVRHVMVGSGQVKTVVQRDDDSNGGGSAAATEILQRTDPQGGPILVSLPTSVVPARKKTSSFQITSVTFGSRLSNDGGDDSADDLDESHTDELSSDLLDVSKTTDYDYSSEDAFSSIKDDCTSVQQSSVILQRSQCPLSSSPSSVPVSSVTPSAAPAVSAVAATATTAAATTGAAPANVSVTVMEAANVPMAVVQNPDIHWQNRFRVVKIDTSEPFRRGRWLCLDFTDPPPASSLSSETCERESGTGSGNSSSTSSVQHGDSLVLDATGAHNVVTASWSGDPNVAVMGGTSAALMDHTQNLGVGLALGQSDQPVLPVSIILQTQQQGNLDFTNTVLHMQGRALQMHHPGATPVVSMPQMAGVCSVPPPPSTASGVPVTEFCSQPPQPVTLQHQTSQQPPQQQSQPPPPPPSSQSSEYSHPPATSLSHTPAPPGAIPPSQPGSEYRAVGASIPTAVSSVVQQSQPTVAQQVQSGLVTMQQSPQELQSASVPSASQQHLPPPSATASSSQDYVSTVSQGLQPQMYQPPSATDFAHSQATASVVPQPPPSCQQISGTQVDQQVFVPSQQLAPPSGGVGGSGGVVVGGGGLVVPEPTLQTVVLDGSSSLAGPGQQGLPQPLCGQQVPSTVSTSSTPAPVAPVVTTVTQDGSSVPATEEGDTDG